LPRPRIMVRAVSTVLAASVFASEVTSFRTRRENASSTWEGKLLPGHIDIARPAFLMLHEDWNEILVSQFGKNCKTAGMICGNPLPALSSISKIDVDDLGQQVSAGQLSGDGGVGFQGNFATRSSGLLWPNKLARTPAEMGDMIAIPDGFLPPGKDNGNIFFAESDGTVHRVTKEKKGSFYHEVEWHDFNGDGHKDMLAARAVKGGPFWAPKFSGELLWFQNPGDDVFQEWKEHLITEGPDVIFKSIPYNGGLAVFSAEFFAERLTVTFLNSKGDKTGYRVIDDTLGKAFAVDYVDLDGDGQKELLATNHQGPKDDVLPAVFGYEVPADLLSGDFPRHSLAYGASKCKTSNAGAGGPGIARAFYPQKGMGGSPYIIAAGDCSFDVWILKPTGNRFEYDVQLIDFEGTIGELLIHDFNGDGITDVLVPDNDFWKLSVITFAKR